MKENNRLYPTQMGTSVMDLLVKCFAELFEYGYTARMEEGLDLIAGGKRK